MLRFRVPLPSPAGEYASTVSEDKARVKSCHPVPADVHPVPLLDHCCPLVSTIFTKKPVGLVEYIHTEKPVAPVKSL
jgi:hypothetical protein